MKVVLTRGAERDLRGIWSRRRKQRGDSGSDGADALLDQLVVLIQTLPTYPRKGPVPPELELLGISTYRQPSQASYRIIYSLERVDNVEAIARTPNLTGLYIGPSDLAQSLGYPIQLDPTSADVMAAIERIPDSTIEASGDLGAGPGTTFRRVILPLAMPGVADIEFDPPRVDIRSQPVDFS